MMMTCRLLCALLVLALCCCPPVFAEENPERPQVDVNSKDPLSSGPGTQEALQATSQSGSQSLGPVAAHENVEVEKPGLTDGDHQPGDDQNLVTREVTDGDTGLQSRAYQSAEQTHQTEDGRVKTTTITKSPEDERNTKPEANTNATSPISPAAVAEPPDASAKTTTTTSTKAPTTTTTTAPETPSTTTTEAPTTTTTRAPSRLREIDGSFCSSAWVCAPLLLAASALAYTAVG
ncbi:mucin TcMUCII, putative [Trypanosoma cruzi marinkellei]|uniref:Mucin TcMUCII, putative n=1 Tax=Trypanosoma cruzi marinkellei TaxID=85056 RepID=K2M1K2_TRYCR|nr:mucin TcMUCII, putative [Trypanosoma cruzi marinkellei]